MNDIDWTKPLQYQHAHDQWCDVVEVFESTKGNGSVIFRYHLDDGYGTSMPMGRSCLAIRNKPRRKVTRRGFVYLYADGNLWSHLPSSMPMSELVEKREITWEVEVEE